MRISLLMILCCITLSLTAQKKITVEDIYQGVFQEKPVDDIRWMKDGRFYTALDGNRIVKYDVTNGAKVKVLINGDNTHPTLVTLKRYLQRPQDNASGYDDNSPLIHASKLKGKFLLVHGTGDDNVHFQNSIALQDELILHGKQFQSFYYPNRAHGIGDYNARVHLYTMMTKFVLNNL